MNQEDIDGNVLLKYQALAATSTDSMGLGEVAVGAAIATVTDFGTSVWNSLTPETMEVETGDILARVNSDALNVYNEHTEAIKMASFVGGVFVPAGLAFKGMSAMRAGAKGANWFSKAGETAELAKVANAYKNSMAGASEALNAARFNLYRNMALNTLVDNAAAEGAIILTMNAHPYMEDYMNDLGGNFLIGLTIGGGIGGIAGTIGTRAAIRGTLAPIAIEANKLVSEGMQVVSEAANKGDQLMVRNANIKMWEDRLVKGKDLATFEKSYLEYAINANKAKLVDDFEEMAVGDMAKVPADVRDSITELVKSDPRFTHVDSLSYLPKKEELPSAKVKKGFIQQAIPTLFEKTAKDGRDITAHKKAVYLKEHDAFVSIKEANDYSNLADAVDSIEELKNAPHPIYGVPRADAFLDRQVMSTAEIAKDDATAFMFVKDMDIDQLNKIKVHPTDMAMLRAIAARANQIEGGAEKLDILVASVSKDVAIVPARAKLEDLVAMTSMAERQMAQELSTKELTNEAIAKRVGVADYEMIGMGGSKFNSELDIIEALNPLNKSIVVGTNLNKVPFAELRSSLAQKGMADINSSLIEAVIHGNPDEHVQELGQLFNKELGFLSRELLRNVDEVSSPGLRSTMFRSANSAVESFGAAGTIATRIGQDVTHFTNKVADAVVKPIWSAMESVRAKESLVVEMNMAMTVNASIAGARVYRDGQFFVQKFDPIAKKYVEEAVTYRGKEFKIVSPEVLALFDTFDKAGRKMYNLSNASNKILGKANLSNIGFWIPAFNPRNKEIAYIVEHTSGKPATSILWGKNSAELNDKILAFEAQAKAEGRNVEILAKDKNLDNFNRIKGREDVMTMEMADISMQHSGSSAGALISTNVEMMNEVINSYDHLIRKGVVDLMDIQLAPVMGRLKMISDRAQALHNEKGMGVIQKAMSSKADPGMVMRNILLGKGLISEHTTWQSTQQGFQVFTDLALENLSKVTSPLVKSLSGGSRDEASFLKMNAELEAKGFTPFKAVDDFHRYKSEEFVASSSLTPRAIALSNSIAATTLLKFMELAQPFVNMVSLPILTSGAMRKMMTEEFMGTGMAKNPQFGVIATMYDTARFMNNPEGAKWLKMGEERELFTSIVSEANAALKHSRSQDPGIMSGIETVLESSFVEMMSKPSTMAEEMTRKMAFMTGVTLAKKGYPGLSDTGVMTFARSFMDEAIGNYTASQRPALFQGTLGVAMGIFQTYMLTMAQQMYRGIERKDWVGLSRQMLAQSSIFGAASLPGFHLISEQIGTHFSDEHTDLQSGLFTAIDDDAATTILYGLPASLGLGITTRGDIQPRIPNPIQGIDSLAAVNLTKQAWQAGKNITEAAFTADASTGRAMMEALSVQSISRPIARLSEFASGRSMTAAGNTVASGITANPFAEEFTLHGAIARVMATRPIEEVKAREAKHLDSVYEGVDGEARKKTIKRLRTYIQDGNLNPEIIQELQWEYLKTGGPQGWRSAVNDAMRQKVMGGNASVKSSLDPDAPYQKMVDDLG